MSFALFELRLQPPRLHKLAHVAVVFFRELRVLSAQLNGVLLQSAFELGRVDPLQQLCVVVVASDHPGRHKRRYRCFEDRG